MDLNVSPVQWVITVQYHLMPLSYVLRAPMPMKLAPLSAKLVMQAIHGPSSISSCLCSRKIQYLWAIHL